MSAADTALCTVCASVLVECTVQYCTVQPDSACIINIQTSLPNLPNLRITDCTMEQSLLKGPQRMQRLA